MYRFIRDHLVLINLLLFICIIPAHAPHDTYSDTKFENYRSASLHMYKYKYAAMEKGYADYIGISPMGKTVAIEVRLTEIVESVRACFNFNIIQPRYEVVYTSEYVMIKEGWYMARNGIYYFFKGGFFYGSNPLKSIARKKWGEINIFLLNEKSYSDCDSKIPT